jgi:hypothetical protein
VKNWASALLPSPVWPHTFYSSTNHRTAGFLLTAAAQAADQAQDQE